mgnify:CR=1 FL=1
MPTFLRMLYKVGFDAFWHFTEDDGWAMASHVALSAILALFPFLIFGTSLASFLGADQFADTAVHLIFDTWPESIAQPLAEQVVAVLTIPRGGLLTISVLAAAYFASNGVAGDTGAGGNGFGGNATVRLAAAHWRQGRSAEQKQNPLSLGGSSK